MQDKDKQTALCRHGHPERNNFYYGKLMTARDFTDEQSYMNEKRWLVNRLGLGWGVLCGLRVRPHAHDKRKVVVEPGVAIDQYGHEIVVCQEETVDLIMGQDGCPPDEHPGQHEGQYEQYDQNPAGQYEQQQAQEDEQKPPHRKSYLYYLSVKYEECGVNPSPITIDSCEGYKEECVYNRTREGFRFIVSREKPDTHDHEGGCDERCYRLLQDPAPAVGCCPERPPCEAVPLAAVCYNPTTDTTALDIDLSMANRKLIFGNEALFKLLACLREEAGYGWAAQGTRRQHVPLLASTIRGLQFRDGRNARIGRKKGYEGKHPFRLTSDSDYIWVTDREDRQVWRIDRATNKPVKSPGLYLEHPTWGIAFDGRYMWMSHHEAFRDDREQAPESKEVYVMRPDEKSSGERPQPAGRPYGKLTRVDVCTLEPQTVDGLPECRSLPECYRFPETGGAPYSVRLRPNPGEVVLHDGDIYVAHDMPSRAREELREYDEQRPTEARQLDEGRQDYDERRPTYASYELSLTRIDPKRGCIVEVIAVPEADGRVPLSRIEAMASDGDALWITYRASSRDRRGERAVIRKIARENGRSVVSEPYRLRGDAPEHVVFDGSRLWVSHNDGLSVLDIETGDEETVNTDTAHTALAYSGGSVLWAAVPGKNEAFITRVDIFSEEEVQRIELIEVDPQTTFEITDMQFDGTYIYVAYYLSEGAGKRGVIHRLLP